VVEVEGATDPMTPGARGYLMQELERVVAVVVEGMDESRDATGRHSHHFNSKSWSGHLQGPTIPMSSQGKRWQ